MDHVIQASVWNALLIMAAVLLVPALPAVAIYKLLPDQRVFVKGNFAGLRLNATGAFGGYVFLVLVAATIVRSDLSSERTTEYDTWQVTGNVRLADSSDSIRQATITLIPPLQTFVVTGARAQFSFYTPMQRTNDLAAIEISVPNYVPAPYPIRYASQRDPLTKQEFRVTRDETRHVLTIRDTLVLNRPPTQPYRPTTAFNPVLLPSR
jgi:hypothetical protein